jgi:NADPH:quinone reductase-like Zn-dependent oxidoreductase
MDFAGVVESVGAGVQRLKVGDEVFGTTDVACGAFAEYACAPEAFVVKKPANVSFEVATATATSASTALQALRVGKCATTEGHKVMVPLGGWNVNDR